MKPYDSPSVEDALDEAAAGWLIEREEGFTPGRAEEFARWCGQDPRHAMAVARMEATLASLDDMPAERESLEARFGAVKSERREPEPKAPALRPITWGWAGGMAALLVLGMVGWWWSARTSPLVTQVYTAKAAEPSRVALPDGSVVDLNTNGRMEVAFSKDKRQVTLLSGEAHFQVAHNATRPFVVMANRVAVRAIGTAFGVRLAEEKVDVLVTEGKVEINRVGAPAFSLATERSALVAGECAQVPSDPGITPRIERISLAEMHKLLSWQDRMTSFADVPLREMVARINKCNPGHLVLLDPELGNRKIGGVIDLRQVDAFVQLLEGGGDIVADRRPNGDVLLRRAH